MAATFGRSNSATLDETIERWVGNLEMIKTALLTIGDSPIANAAIRVLSEHSHLEYIVFSRKKRKVSLLSRIREYGFLYSLHALVCRIFFRVPMISMNVNFQVLNRSSGTNRLPPGTLRRL